MSPSSNTLPFKSLLDFGLSEKEASIYLALLELEAAPVNKIAKKSGVNRSSTYVVLDALMKKGLASISDDKKVQQYVATSPEILLRIAEGTAAKQAETLKKLRTLVPELKATHKDTRRKPKVRVFEGAGGIKEVYFDIFSSEASELKVYANPANILKAFPDFMETHDASRVKKGMRIQMINPANEKAAELGRTVPPGPHDEIALIPESMFKFSYDMAIYGDTVTFVSPEESFGIIIENREIADTLRNSFNLSWQEAKRLDKIVRAKKKPGKAPRG